MKVLVCGGAGYIGSHTCVALAERGHESVVYDNFCNSSRVAVERVGELVGRHVEVIEGDIRDAARLHGVFAARRFDAVIHFAALKSVGESHADPLSYFENNISGTITLLQQMRAASVDAIVFSSSATVYGNADAIPVREESPLGATNPYGRTKLVMEQLIAHVCESHPGFNAALLRYFNPIGAHPSGRIGEDPRGIPNNLMPYITQVAVGRRDTLSVFGSDYPTRDGTGVRDYVHVMDLADAHVAALETMIRANRGFVINLGTGRGYSVLEVVRAFEAASGTRVPLHWASRRPGDVAELWADPSKATRTIGWRAQRDLGQMCQDAWRWQQANPEGYR